MIICPKCNHQNPEGSVQCESCYIPLPKTAPCPNCGASVQTDATFCGQCGYNLQAEEPGYSGDLIADSADLSSSLNSDFDLFEEDPVPTVASNSPILSPWDDEEDNNEDEEENDFYSPEFNLPDTDLMSSVSSSAELDMDILSWKPPTPEEEEELEEIQPLEELIPEESFIAENTPSNQDLMLEIEPELEEADLTPVLENTNISTPEALEFNAPEWEEPSEIDDIPSTSENLPEVPAMESIPSSSSPMNSTITESVTQLQLQRLILFHVQTNTNMEIAQNLDVIRIGKPNSQVPPDIDVSGFPNSEIVSRVHANIRVEGDTYFLEDLGSSNGTYVNHNPLLTGNRHRLRSGDRIALGKGDLVTFIFKLGS